tara:strand:- start:241 stop:1095 length:855 start_codon:yes stop_codon:yes gene_type:complete
VNSKFKKSILFALNNLRNFLYQKLKYNKKYLYYVNSDEIEKHKKNFYLASIKKREKQSLKNTIEIDFNKLSFDNSINLDDPINPLVLTANEINLNSKINLEETSLYKFFKNFKPKNLGEVFFIDENINVLNDTKLDKLNQYTLFYPWFHKYPQKFLVPGMFGPKDISFPLIRFIRLKNLINLIGKYGFKPDFDDQISGYILKNDSDYRFVITAGTHRASVLKSLYFKNKEIIEVKYDDFRIKKNFFIINLQDINQWPGVKSGYIKKNEAEELFKSFFKFKIMNS